MSGRRGSGSFGSGRTAGYASGEDRTSPWLEAIAGIRSDCIPGWAPSPCRLPGPVTRCGADFGAGFHRQCTATQELGRKHGKYTRKKKRTAHILPEGNWDPVLGLVVGSYQGCSEALHGLAREAAKARATAKWRQMGARSVHEGWTRSGR